MLSLIIEGKISCVIFPSWCNIVFGNAFVLVLEEKLVGARNPSWWNLFLGNVFVLMKERKEESVRFHSHAILFWAMHFC